MFLYRYNKLSNRTIDYLENKNFYFSNPFNFNDPFECDLNSLTIHQSKNIDQTYEEYKNVILKRLDYLYRLINHYDIRIYDNDDPVPERYYFDDVVDVYFEEARQLEKEYNILIHHSKKSKFDAVEESWINKKSAISKRLGVLCFSEDSTNLLMWSHYADNHKGICFQYDSRERPVKGWKKFQFHKVNYKNDRSINVLERGFENALFDLLTTKSLDWSYEKEYRLVSLKGPGLQKNTMNSLTGIILGSRFFENSEELIENFIKGIRLLDHQRRCVKKIRYYYTKKDNNEFKINTYKLSNVNDLIKYIERKTKDAQRNV